MRNLMYGPDNVFHVHFGSRSWRWLYLPFKWTHRFGHGGWLYLGVPWLRRFWNGN